MSMTKYGLMGLTPKGKQLLNKVQSGQGNIKITKLKAGAGIYEEGEDYTQREDLKDPRQEFEITSKTVESDDSVLLVVKLTNYIDEEEYLETGYKIREMAFYADDPDDGEICYSIMAGTDDTMMDYMPAYDGLIPSVITNYYQVQVANAGQVEIVLASTESVYSEEGANGLRIYQSKMQYLDGGEWKDLDVDASNMSVDIDESSTVEGITDFPSFLATLVGKLSIFNTIRNFKAGLQFVLHMGQLVSNTSTNNANLPASAAAVYQNAQEIAALNTEMPRIYQLDGAEIKSGVQVDTLSPVRASLIIWGVQNGVSSPFGIIIGINPSTSPQIQFSNFGMDELTPTYSGNIVKLPVNEYSNVVIWADKEVSVSGY